MTDYLTMPALKNPRHEAFAQAIVASLANGSNESHSNGKAYRAAGYIASNRNSADAAASRLLRIVKPLTARVAELQAEANARIQPKLDISRERIGRRLDKASRIAEAQENPAAMAQCELGMAKVFHSTIEQEQSPTDFKSAKSMHDIGTRLLQSIGFASPDDASIREAIEANDRFIDELQAIHQRALKGLCSSRTDD